ncbi:hypothetical protein ACFORG_05500 [Lutimaribacter marinistellae]|uniref:Invasion protein IalB, involved in pathogenesis n=1 Tax=Lutimaribacter marinistellae TaxID=1820329 RepID=A0ABV7TEQ3_9RHOB
MSAQSLFKTIALAGAVFATSAVASDNVLPSADTQFTKWGEESGWTIYVDPDRKACLIEAVDKMRNVVQMGLTADHGLGYMGIFTQADIELESGEENIAVLLGETLYFGTVSRKTKHLPEGYKGGYFLTDDPEFVEQVRKQYVMTVFPEKEYAFSVNLDGTFKAIEAARKCNEEQMGS